MTFFTQNIIFILMSFSVSTVSEKDTLYDYKFLNESLEIARENKDQKALADIYLKLAKYEDDVLADYEKSFEYYRRALEYQKIINDTTGIQYTNLAIAKSYLKTGFINESITIFQSLIATYSSKKDTTQLALVYFNINKAYNARGDFEKSIEYLKKATILNNTLNDTVLLTQILVDQIESYKLDNELDSALNTAFKVFNLNIKKNNSETIAQSLFYIGQINKMKKDYDKAIKYLVKSELLIPFIPYSDLRKNVYKNLSDTYSSIGNYGRAYDYLQKYTLLNDSILNKSRIESFNNLAFKYSSKEKESSIEVLKLDKQFAEEKNQAQRRTLYILIFGLFIVLSSIYFIIKFYDQRISTSNIINKQMEEINNQKIRELEDNMKMNSMRSVIEGQEKERERIAKDLHDSLGGLLSSIKLQFDHVSTKDNNLTSSKEYLQAHKMLDTAVEEVRNISRNLQPGSLENLGLVPAIRDLINRLEGDAYPDIDFQFYQMPDKLDKMIALSVYRILQELITNTIKHAHANEILLQINTEENELVIQYEDDGVGFEQKNVKRSGMGLENIKSRVNYLHGTIVIDSQKNEGISVLIRIKYK